MALCLTLRQGAILYKKQKTKMVFIKSINRKKTPFFALSIYKWKFLWYNESVAKDICFSRGVCSRLILVKIQDLFVRISCEMY